MLAIVGPTASGKSCIAVEIAKKIDGAIVNGDPFQAFLEIPIGTGQPSLSERQGIPHYGYGELPLDLVLNPASFGQMARDWLDTVVKSGKRPILVTGSGLYLRGVWNQLDEMPDVPEKIVKKMRRLCSQLGSPALHRYLASVDPVRASQLHPNDGSRIQRAMALHLATGERPSKFLSGVGRMAPAGWHLLLVLPTRDSLRDRVARRVKSMLELGWREEVQRLAEKGLLPHIMRLRPLGYDLLLECPDSDMAEQKIILATQAYAKRQETWFKNQLPNARRLDPDTGCLDVAICNIS
ncbi:MAG: tRNA (adenosine(37)-N6)-dimethylallyltransferase MiaA [Holophagaceae bacterium]|nr:tRNA (adenosine(37)-N6)-dimethylallyltransferase MiaA [Holophagaceae bacterium]